jgi:RNA polymerase sigma factor (TIGR02999 family)
MSDQPSPARSPSAAGAAAPPATPPESPDQAGLLAQVYDQLRSIARARLAREAPGHTLQATELVHEAFLKLRGHPALASEDRARFFYAAAEAMRRILIDHARTKGRIKRGGGKKPVIADVAELAADADGDEILALDEAVCRLEKQDADAARVVRLRFFAGLNVEETAEAMGVSERTIKRDWQFARAWLFRELSRE